MEYRSVAGNGDVCVVSGERKVVEGLGVYVVREVRSDDVSRWYAAPTPLQRDGTSSCSVSSTLGAKHVPSTLPSP